MSIKKLKSDDDSIDTREEQTGKAKLFAVDNSANKQTIHKIIFISSGLGNQMFQYAFYLFLKNKIKEDFLFNTFRCIVHNKFELEKIFSNITVKQTSYFQNMKFYGLHFKIFNRGISLKKLERLIFKKQIFFKPKKNLFQENPNNRFSAKDFNKGYDYFSGHFININYLTNNEAILKHKFKFPELQDERNKKILDKISSTNSVSIHIRLGDYLHTNFINLSNSNYYQMAIAEIKSKVENPYFFIFSDEIEKCREMFKDLKKCHFVDGNKNEKSYIDMQLISLCKNNIVANSTFSFWGAFLNQNQNRTIICPLDTFKYPEDWITISQKNLSYDNTPQKLDNLKF